MAEDTRLPHGNEGMAVGPWKRGTQLRHEVVLPEGFQAKATR